MISDCIYAHRTLKQKDPRRDKPWIFFVEQSEKIEGQRQLDLPILAGPKDFHPGEAQGASVARTMSVKLGVGVSQRRANM